MRHILPTALIIALTSPCASDAQVKKSGGFFGFNRNQEQISSGLFPSEITGQPVSQKSVEPATSAPTPPSQPSSQSDGIFRGGSPGPVAPVSYIIENGKKIEKDSKSDRKGSFFGFGKKDKDENSEAPVVSPVPSASPYVSPTAPPVVSAPDPVPAPATPAPVAAPQAKPAPAIEWSAPAPKIGNQKKEEVVAEMEAETPSFKTEEKEAKSGGFFSFFNRKKSEPVAEIPTVSPPAVDVEAPAAGGTVAVVDNGTANIFEVPAMPESLNESKKEKKSIADTFLAPVSKMRPSKKELDLTGAETIISDGEIVSDDGQDLTDRIVTMQGDGVKEPPKIVNGVKTYSSWEDVEGSTVSAADKIIRQIR